MTDGFTAKTRRTEGRSLLQGDCLLDASGAFVVSHVTRTEGAQCREESGHEGNQGSVLGNKVMVGTVDAARANFVSGVDDLIEAETLHPGWLGSLLTTPVDGLAQCAKMIHHLTHDNDAIKVYVEVSR